MYKRIENNHHVQSVKNVLFFSNFHENSTVILVRLSAVSSSVNCKISPSVLPLTISQEESEHTTFLLIANEGKTFDSESQLSELEETP